MVGAVSMVGCLLSARANTPDIRAKTAKRVCATLKARVLSVFGQQEAASLPAWSCVESTPGWQRVAENRWFWIRSGGGVQPRLKASFQPRSARGISERGRMVAIGSAWAIYRRNEQPAAVGWPALRGLFTIVAEVHPGRSG